MGADGPLEAAVLLRRSGVHIASWSRSRVSEDVVSVMGATLMGSVETLVEALGAPSPEFVLVQTPRRRMLVRRVDGSRILFLIASRDVTELALKAEGDRLVARVSEAATRKEAIAPESVAPPRRA